ncbi:Uncharacterised protein [Tsukamurella paurometabola]|uniref:Uncharacterized protein n=1 Tax=Tsukamurella paurometabola TaxID=2061 RepID=A0A3P8MDI0_TSUPA|nr:Uncharacterised protein [Tsukamurella paurometabola]
MTVPARSPKAVITGTLRPTHEFEPAHTNTARANKTTDQTNVTVPCVEWSSICARIEAIAGAFSNRSPDSLAK